MHAEFTHTMRRVAEIMLRLTCLESFGRVFLNGCSMRQDGWIGWPSGCVHRRRQPCSAKTASLTRQADKYEISLLHIEFPLFSPPEWLVTTSRTLQLDKSIIVWHLTRDPEVYGVPRRRLTGHNHFVQDVVLSSDGQFALSASWGNRLIWRR